MQRPHGIPGAIPLDQQQLSATHVQAVGCKAAVNDAFPVRRQRKRLEAGQRVGGKDPTRGVLRPGSNKAKNSPLSHHNHDGGGGGSTASHGSSPGT